MTATPAPLPEVPDAHDRAGLNAALLAIGAETGLWDDHGNPAPCPDDIDHWTPDTHSDPDPDGPQRF